MHSIHAFVLGVVQGITEFFPISSSGHLLAFHDFLGFDIADSLRFDASLHLGTFFALLLYFWTDVVRLVRGFFWSLRRWKVKTDEGQRLAWLVIVGAIPAGIVGVAAEGWIETNVRNLWVVAGTLLAGAVAFWWVEAWRKRQQATTTMTFATALVVGLAQVLALIPGISRSGATIVAGLGRKLDRAAAARYAFLVSLPVVAGAGLLKITDIVKGNPSAAELSDVAIGLVTSTVVGYFVIRFFLRFVQRHSLSVFAWYRVAAALALVVFLSTR